MEPLVLTSSDHVPFCELLGLQAHACWPDGEAFMMANDTQLKAMADGDAMAHMHAIGEYRSKNVQAAAVSALAALRTFRPAMLLTGVLDWLVCEPLAMLLGVPAVYTGLQPNALTAEMRSGFGESPRFAYIAMLAQFILTVKLGAAPEIKLVREALDKELGSRVMMAETAIGHYLHEWHTPLTPVIIGISEHLRGKHTDLPAAYASRCVLSGYWVLSERSQLDLAKQKEAPTGGKHVFGGGDAMEALRAFLSCDQGKEPPVYMGWGSMIAVSPEHMACLAVRSLMIASKRGIILGGFAKLHASLLASADAEDADELIAYAAKNVLFVQSAPHEWLFPKCSALVHHGGAGTTAAGMRSGTPAIITPCFADQFDHASNVAKAGVGVALPQIKRVSAPDLAAALKRIDEPMREAAKALALKLCAENGPDKAGRVLRAFYEEEVATGKWAAAFEARVARRRLFRTRRFMYGGFAGAIFSTLWVLRAWATKRV